MVESVNCDGSRSGPVRLQRRIEPYLAHTTCDVQRAGLQDTGKRVHADTCGDADWIQPRAGLSVLLCNLFDSFQPAGRLESPSVHAVATAPSEEF